MEYTNTNEDGTTTGYKYLSRRKGAKGRQIERPTESFLPYLSEDENGTIFLRHNMYTYINFKTKKALKEAVAARQAWLTAKNNPSEPQPLKSLILPRREPRAIRVYQPNEMFGRPDPTEGRVYLEGPHYPEPHRWYASAELKNGEVVKVR